MNVKNTFERLTKFRLSLPKWTMWLWLAMLTTIAIGLTKQLNLLELLESAIAKTENNYQQWGDRQPLTNPWLLVSFAFGGGLLASISPCILAMLPVNLSYIGTLNVKSRRAAVWNATGFVLGVVTMSSIFGLFASVAGAFMVEWRGYINVAVGIIIIWMGLSIGGLVHLPLPRAQISLPPFAGTYGVGLTFALVSSPCASPVLFAVLAAAGATGSSVWSVVTMVAYALGYTAVIFAASLLAGVIKATRQILINSEVVTRSGGLALGLMGVYYVVSGVFWFL